jgi:hypothetical protein
LFSGLIWKAGTKKTGKHPKTLSRSSKLTLSSINTTSEWEYCELLAKKGFTRNKIRAGTIPINEDVSKVLPYQ